MNRICVLVTGSREWTDWPAVRHRLLVHYNGPAWPRPGHVLLAGDARGADSIAQKLGDELGFIVEPTPYFSEFGKKGGGLRNQLLVDKLVCYGRHGYAMRVEAFVLPSSVGTHDCLRRVARAQSELLTGKVAHFAFGKEVKHIVVNETRWGSP